MTITDTGLPPGVADVVLNRAQLAEALGKTEPTITTWLREGLPFITEGTNGKAYEFQLSACYRWMREREIADAARRTEADQSVRQMRLALVGGTDATGGEGDLSPKQRRELYDAEQAFMITALTRGDLVKRGDVVNVLEDVLLTIRDVVTALPDRLEREAGLSGKALDLAIEVCDRVLSDAQNRVADRMQGSAPREAAE